jgi:cobalt-zinc-cadmium efflux system membrane fusion protein
MTPQDIPARRWPVTIIALALAIASGFGIAKLTGPEKTPEVQTTAGPASAVRTLEIPASHLEVANIVIEAVSTGSLSTDILAPGTATAAPNGLALVTAHTGGTVVKLSKRLGDSVNAGEILALVESRDVAGIAADRSVADAKVALARKSAAREQHLYDEKVTPRQDLEAAQAELAAAEAESRRAHLSADSAHIADDGRSAAVVSPISGRITHQAISLGEFVQPETELFRVVDPRFVQLEAPVTVSDAARITPGDSAQIMPASGKSLSATVRAVSPALDPQSRAATVVLSLAEGQDGIVPGETLQVRISPKLVGPAAILIPDEAIQRLDGRDVVFVRTDTGFTVQPVTVAARGNGRASVISGLQTGQKIATRNAFLLKAELGKGAEDEE